MFESYTATQIVLVLISLVVSLSIHEAVHAYVAHALGDTTAQEEGRLTLNPLNHIDPFMTIILPIVTLLIFKVPFLAAKPVPFNPDRVKYDEFGGAMIAAAGPLSNFVLAFLAALVLNSAGFTSTLSDGLQIFISLNIVIGVFNLVPIPPLDGSRVLYAFAPEALQQVMRNIEPYGFFIIFGLVFAGAGAFLSNITSTILSWLPGF
jgi:Zn-dependent protease